MPQAASAFADEKAHRLRQHTPETVPVSAPFGFAGVVALRPWSVRP
jgi:hypothetical protein